MDDFAATVTNELRLMRAEFGDLRTEMRDLRTEMREEFRAVRTEMREELRAVRTEMHGEFGSLRSDLAATQRQVAQIGWTLVVALIGALVAMIVAVA